MRSFRLIAERGLYLVSEGFEEQIQQDTNFIIFAREREVAVELAERFIGQKGGRSSPRISTARWEPIAEWMESWHPVPKFEPLLTLAKRLSAFTGSISIQGMVIVNPAEDHDTITICAEENGRRRVLTEPLFIMEDEQRIEWGDPGEELDVRRASRAVQMLF